MPTHFLQCYGIRWAYAEPRTCNLIRLKLQLNVIHFQICRFHKGSLLFPATMTSLHPGPCYSINSGHFGSFFPVTFRPLLQTHQNFRLYSFQTMASKFPEDQGSDLSKHPAVTTYMAPPVTKPLLASLNVPPVPEEGNARLHWLLDINQQFFAWELQQVVSIYIFHLRPSPFRSGLSTFYHTQLSNSNQDFYTFKGFSQLNMSPFEAGQVLARAARRLDIEQIPDEYLKQGRLGEILLPEDYQPIQNVSV